jgi:PRC-barrel domain
MPIQEPAALSSLNDTNLTVATSDIDIRGWNVKDSHGRFIGTVDDLMVDRLDNKVRSLRLDLAGFIGPGEGICFFAIEGIVRITDSEVVIGHPPGNLSAQYAPDIVLKREFCDELSGPFGNP